MLAAGMTEKAARDLTGRMRRTMSEHAMINRTDAGLARALADIDAIRTDMGLAAAPAKHDEPAVARTIRLRSQLSLARAMLEAMRARTESLGSHYRADDNRRERAE